MRNVGLQSNTGVAANCDRPEKDFRYFFGSPSVTKRCDDRRENLGWENGRWYGTPAVIMPYPDENNRSPLTRYRVGITGSERFRWQRFQEGQKMRPYGLWNLAQIRERGYVIIVEGETDCATLMYAGFPVLGTPGNNWQASW